MEIAVGLLGPVMVQITGATIPISASRSRCVYVTLALHAGRAVSQDVLAEALWDTRPPVSFVANLRTHAHRLRRELGTAGARLRASNGGYVLDIEPSGCDHVRFRTAGERGRAALAAGDAHLAVAHLAAALELWRGDHAAEGVARLGPLLSLLDALDEERSRVTEDLAEALLRVGDPRAALVRLSALLAAAPLRDRAWRLRLEAHHRLGEHGAFRECYRRVVDLFRRELGIGPDPELSRLYESVVGLGRRVPAAS